MTDLSTVTDDDLMDELLNRNDVGFIVLLQNRGKVHNTERERMVVNRKWKGDSLMIAGLAQDIGRIAIIEFDKRFAVDPTLE